MLVEMKIILLFGFFVSVIGNDDIWVAEIIGGSLVAELIAARHGFNVISKLEPDEDFYILRENDSSLVQKRTSLKIENHETVLWMEKQQPLKRDKRGIFSWLKSRYRSWFNDILWEKEWYIQDYRRRTELPVLDLNVVPCYREGITGAGIKVVVVDDGLEINHIDLDPAISYDYNENDPDPSPRYDLYGTNSHGTKCAGEIAMIANNKICGVGIAYNATLGGLKILDGNPNDLTERKGLTHSLDKIDIYSNSWGPTDDGMTMEQPGKLLRDGLEKGTTKGRGGKGAIYIFAAGNGKYFGDNCGADGYVNSIYTVAIASASQHGKTVHYGERCSAIHATAYSSGGATTNLNNTCTLDHTGTSAAAPLASGIAALVLQANPNLTWRDFQHLIAWTSEVAPLSSNLEWTMNGFGFWVSPDFGFGLLNGYSLVKAARQFKTVPKNTQCHIPFQFKSPVALKIGSIVNVKVATVACKDEAHEINYLEHVELEATISYTKRGSLSVYLTSPAGTESVLLEERFRDTNRVGLRRWTMMSVHFWGENPVGVWTVTVKTNDKDIEDEFRKFEGRVRRLKLKFYGTRSPPNHYKRGQRKYAPFFVKPYSYKNLV